MTQRTLPWGHGNKYHLPSLESIRDQAEKLFPQEWRINLAVALSAFVVFGWLFFCLFRLSSHNLEMPQFNHIGYPAAMVSAPSCPAGMCGFTTQPAF